MITSSIQDILMMYVWEDDKELNRTQDIVDYGRPKLFDFSYPLYDSKMKEQFETDFIRHFYTREIGSESIALFKLRLQDYLYLNMEKWERLYLAMDDELNPFNNIDVRTTRSTDETEETDRDQSEDERLTGQTDRTEQELQTGKRDRTTQEDVASTQDSTTTSHADDFTRNLEEETPDERLQITARDGVGVIEYASQITESKNVNDSEQTMQTTSDTDRKTSGNENTSQDTQQTGREEEQKDRTKTELEKQLRAFEQALDEHKVGRQTHLSFVQLYDEYIQHFQGLHRLMFKDMEKLFLGVF